jgi:hypothetical protein
MRSRPLLLRGALALAAAAATAAVVPATAGSNQATRAAVGCNGTPAVVAFHPGAKLLRPQPAHLPTACGVSTGYPGAESHLVVRNDGTVVYTPAVLPSGLAGTGTAPIPVGDHSQSNASPGAMVVTSDDGNHWRLVKPSGVTWNPTDHSEYVDPTSGRTFFEDYGPIPLAPQLGAEQEGPAYLNWSDDLKHWHHVVLNEVFLPENPRFASGVAPKGQPKPHGYPNVLYFCANTNVGFVSPVIGGRLCWHSLNGGSGWGQPSVLFTGAAPQHPECNGQGENYSAIDGNYPQAAPDGRLYVMVSCGNATYLARSDDEAVTFPVIHAQGKPVTLPVPPTTTGTVGGTPELRIGRDGTFMLVYQQGARLLMRLSSTHGVTWSNPIDLSAPGVTAIKQWSLATTGDSDFAIAFLGHRKGRSTWDGYLTTGRDVLGGIRSAAGPVFYSGQLNRPGHPLLYGDSVQGSGYLQLPGGINAPYPPPFNNQMFGNDFIGVAIAPDGTPWGSFTQDCGTSPDDASCKKQDDQTRGFAGHLAWH